RAEQAVTRSPRRPPARVGAGTGQGPPPVLAGAPDSRERRLPRRIARGPRSERWRPVVVGARFENLVSEAVEGIVARRRPRAERDGNDEHGETGGEGEQRPAAPVGHERHNPEKEHRGAAIGPNVEEKRGR